MSTEYIPPADDLTGTLESSVNKSQVELNSHETLLPRLAWNSQIAYLRVLFKAKKALDRIEREADIL
ncbi:hypothetical protein [Nostoc sp. TCL240-02]|uniref:hypothetical protein n=1 Tax=Nostoc sp. TCL240-02 TaxID=2572090 RepID=UPI00157FBA01|nr:hypothetical protein [Nostoc sp. TCL240-02]QKQ72702.1 hypothetical protein FBB35_04315 [Nostoc sp. TCL240-02]